MTPVIEARHVCIDYKLGGAWVNAIYDVSLCVDPLEIHGLVGESGSGKSTLALALMNYLADNARICSGQVLLDGDDLVPKTRAEMRAIWGRALNLVPQDALAALNPAYTIGDQIAEITRLHAGLSRRDAWARAVEMLRAVKIADPETVARRYPHQLSGGMQQRVTIAMALSTQPRLLVLDEPTTALDVTTQAVILDLFRDLIHDNHAAALYVSHDMGTVAQLCDRVTVLYAGEVMESAPVRDLFTQPLHPYTAGLLASLPHPTAGSETRLPTIDGVAPPLHKRPAGCVFAPRCPVALDLCAQQKPPLEPTGANGHMVRCHRWPEIHSGALQLAAAPAGQTATPPPRRGTVLQASNIRKQFTETSLLDTLLRRQPPAVRAVDDASLTIKERSTLGLVGESGSGKTTLARCIVALIEADSGTLELCEVPISNKLEARSRETLRNLRMIFQNPNDTLNPYHTVRQALARPLRVLHEPKLSDAEIDARIAELLQAVRLTPDYANRYPAELSGGEKQRIAIARAFAANPALIVADEPTSSLDVSVQAVILNLLKDLRAEKGASYLLISHDLDVIAYLADWIAVMYLGQIVEEGETMAVYDPPWHPYTEALLSAIPVPDPTAEHGAIRLTGEMPSARHLPSGCRFHTRCPRKIGALCEQEAPPWRDAGGGHFIRCHIPINELIALQAARPRLPKDHL
jgi:peptide/nickel transport system ATP-binding protein